MPRARLDAQLAQLQAENQRLLALNHDFLTLLANTSDFIYFKDQDSRIRFCSQALATLCGYPDWHDLIGKHDRELFPEETARIYAEEEVPVFRDGQPLLNKIDPYFDAHGGRRWVSTSKWPVIGDDGRTVVGLFGISRDITEGKELAELVQTREEKVEAILRDAPVAIAVLAGRRFTFVNARFCETVGYPRAELLGVSARLLCLSAEAYAALGAAFDAEARTASAAEARLRRKDGQVIDVVITRAPRAGRDPQAETTFMVLDITARKQAEQTLVASAAALAESNRLKDVFTDVLRHDILNPINAIKLGTELLLLDEIDPHKTDVLRRVQRSTLNLVEMTLNAAKLATARPGQDPGFRSADPTQMLRSVLPDLEHLRAEKDITIVDHSVGGFVATFSPMMKDVFANLISNAIKYSPSGTRVDLCVVDRGGSWSCAVQDQGAGVPDEYKQKIFNRFERIEREGVKGSGLGLTIAKQIVALHGGDLWVEDNPAGGSVFVVWVPAQPGSRAGTEAVVDRWGTPAQTARIDGQADS